MAEDQNVYEEIRKRVHKRYKRRVDFAESVMVFVAVNVIMWLLWAFTDYEARISVLVPLIVSGISAAMMTSEVVSFVLGEAEERAIQREIEVERQWRREASNSEKAKRDDAAYMRLSDDGELVDVADYDPDIDGELRQNYR